MNALAKRISTPTTPAINNKPWSGLGSKINPNDTLEESLAKAELDWTAKRTQVLFNVDGDLKQGTSQILYRSDDCFQLGIVSDKYNIAQPSEIIRSYKHLADLKAWPMEYMGIIDGGRRIWALIKTDQSCIVNGSKMETYLLLSTTYDGNNGTVAKFINLTEDYSSLSLGVADNVAYSQFSLNHKANFDIQKITSKLNLVDKASIGFKRYAETLSKIRLSDADAINFIVEKLEGKQKSLEDLSTRQLNIVESVFETYESDGKSDVKKTALGLVQTIAQHVDYNVGRNVNNRMRAAWFGLGNKLKVDSFNSLLALA